MVEMTIDAEKVETLRADDRGRVYLGPKYAGRDVDIAVITSTEPDGEGEEP